MDDPHQHAHAHPPPAGGAECLACPICVLLQALGTSSPEAVQHLAAAGRELAQALQAVLAARTAAPSRPSQPVQRIRVD